MSPVSNKAASCLLFEAVKSQLKSDVNPLESFCRQTRSRAQAVMGLNARDESRHGWDDHLTNDDLQSVLS